MLVLLQRVIAAIDPMAFMSGEAAVESEFHSIADSGGLTVAHCWRYLADKYGGSAAFSEKSDGKTDAMITADDIIDMRQQLKGLRVSGLRKSAIAAGVRPPPTSSPFESLRVHELVQCWLQVTDAEMDDADDASDTKAALVELIIKQSCLAA